MAGPSAILFDGTTDAMLRGGDLTGIIDGKTGTFSSWIRTDVLGKIHRIMTNTSGRVNFRIEMANTVDIVCANSVGTPILAGLNTFVVTLDAWFHYIVSWDLGNGLVKLFVDDVDETAVSPTVTDDTIAYSQAEWSIGSSTGLGQRLSGALADYYFSTEFIDLTVESNRRKFIDAAGNPVYLGNNGENPTGTPPAIYLRGDQTDQGINSGTGGDFVSQGTQVPGETAGPGDYSSPSLSGRILDTNIIEVASLAGNDSVSPPFRIGGRGWDAQLKVPEALAGIEVSNDKMNWVTATDKFGNPLTSLSSSMFPVGQRPAWMRFIVAPDLSSPRTFTSIAAYRKLTV